MTAISIAGLDHVVIRARDLLNLQRFYESLFDARAERTVESIGLVQIRIGAHLLDLIDDSANDQRLRAPNMDHFCVQVEPWHEDDIRAHLTRLGVEAGPTERRYGALGHGPSIYLSDPEGNLVELKGPPDVKNQ